MKNFVFLTQTKSEEINNFNCGRVKSRRRWWDDWNEIDKKGKASKTRFELMLNKMEKSHLPFLLLSFSIQYESSLFFILRITCCRWRLLAEETNDSSQHRLLQRERRRKWTRAHGIDLDGGIFQSLDCTTTTTRETCTSACMQMINFSRLHKTTTDFVSVSVLFIIFSSIFHRFFCIILTRDENRVLFDESNFCGERKYWIPGIYLGNIVGT